MCFLFQDDKDTSSNKESLDDLFPAEDEEQSSSEALLGFEMCFYYRFEHLPVSKMTKPFFDRFFLDTEEVLSKCKLFLIKISQYIEHHSHRDLV